MQKNILRQRRLAGRGPGEVAAQPGTGTVACIILAAQNPLQEQKFLGYGTMTESVQNQYRITPGEMRGQRRLVCDGRVNQIFSSWENERKTNPCSAGARLAIPK